MTSRLSRDDPERFEPSGFFLLRTPLLPFDTLLEWSQAGADAAGDSDDAANALEKHLLDVASRPEVLEALFVASRSLFDAMAKTPNVSRRALLALARYVCRMASRPTPFALNAGYSLGVIGGGTRLVLRPLACAEKRVRIGVQYLSRVTAALAEREDVWKRAPLVPNTSLYPLAGQHRYVETHFAADGRSHSLQAVAGHELGQALELAHDGLSGEALAGALAASLEADRDEALAFVERLASNQILEPDVHPRITASEPLEELAARLERLGGEASAVAGRLAFIGREARRVESLGLGAAPEEYAALESAVRAALGEDAAPDEVLHITLHRPGQDLTLDAGLAQEACVAAEHLRRLFAAPEQDPLHAFRERFAERYEEQFVPLVEALDQDLGAGLSGLGLDASEDPPLLRNLRLPAATALPPPLPCHRLLIAKVGQALDEHADEITIAPGEIERMALPEALPLPDAFAIIGNLLGAGDDAPAGRPRFHLYSVLGPSGGRLFGRFCQGDPEIARRLQHHLRQEESLTPDAVFAEVVNLPQGRSANIVARPQLRRYEIPFLGSSDAPRARQIPVSDLLLGVRDGRLVLWSRSLDRQVVPRVTNAHNFTSHGVSIYRFLAALQPHGVAAALSWDWGPLSDLPFLPRVRLGRIALSRATWRVPGDALRPLAHGTPRERRSAAEALTASRRLPRFVAFSEADNELVVDWSNPLCVEAFAAVAQKRDTVLLRELLPGPHELMVEAPDGRRTSEIVLPFVRVASGARRSQARPLTTTHSVRRTCAPGGEWLFYKLYTGYATADRLIAETIAPLVAQLLGSGALRAWFFVRYNDPEFHLRVRLHGAPERLWNDVLAAFSDALRGPLEQGRLWRVQIDTYAREIERYGGSAGIALAEQVFWADSEAVVALLPLTQTDDDLRWQMAARGADTLLSDLGFGPAEKVRVYAHLVELYGREFRVDREARADLAGHLRERHRALRQLLAAGPSHPSAQAYEWRSARLAPLAARLRRLHEAGELCSPFDQIAMSYVHMHLNRWLRTTPRAQELVLYDLLHRLYVSEVSRTAASGSGASRSEEAARNDLPFLRER